MQRICATCTLTNILHLSLGTILPLPSSPLPPPPFVTYGGDNVCPDCRRRYESFGPKRKIIEGGCGHARCLECCRRDVSSPGKDGWVHLHQSSLSLSELKSDLTGFVTQFRIKSDSEPNPNPKPNLTVEPSVQPAVRSAAKGGKGLRRSQAGANTMVEPAVEARGAAAAAAAAAGTTPAAAAAEGGSRASSLTPRASRATAAAGTASTRSPATGTTRESGRGCRRLGLPASYPCCRGTENCG